VYSGGHQIVGGARGSPSQAARLRARFYTGVLAVEFAGGVQASSLSLVVDAVHNLSDEVALAFLCWHIRCEPACPVGFSARRTSSTPSAFSPSVSFWCGRVVERLWQPVPVLSVVPVIAGLLGAGGNLGVACVLREPAMEDPAIRLAYVHNLGDTLLSLAPVVAGVFILVSGRPIFDLLVALLIAAFIIVTTIRSVVVSHKELLWPTT
jgi:Co/Zn/Cd efflux system component